MISKNDIQSENTKVFEAYTKDSKKFEILMKREIESSKLMFQTILLEESKKKIFCSLYDISALKHIEVLSPYNSIEEIFFQIIDYIDVNEKLKIKSSIYIQANKATLSIPINSRKYQQLCFELRYENSELVEILLDTIDKLVTKNEEFEKRISKLEEAVFNQKKKEIKQKAPEQKDFEGKFENMTNVKTIKPHTSYISNIISLQDNKIATSSLDYYIKIFNKDTWEEIISIKENSYVDWIEQIKDGTLISCPRDKTIRFYEINDKSYKNINTIQDNASAWKMKELENGKLISTMSDSNIKIWMKKNNTIECKFVLNNGGESYDILEIKNNEIVALSGNNLNFYDLDKRDKIYSLSGFESFYLNPGRKFCKVNDKILLVSGNNNLFLVDIQSYQMIKKIICNLIITLYKISDNLVLSGQSNGDIKQWECNGKDIKLYSYKNKAHQGNIMGILKINNFIISGSSEGEMKFWEFK